MFDFGYECCKKIITSNIAENDTKYIKTCSNLSFYKEQLMKDNTDTLTFFYLYNDVIQNIMNSGDTNGSVDPKIHECWNILFEKNRAKLTEIPQNIKNNYRSVFPNSNKKLANASGASIETIITFTTCKRFDLFKETVGSILNHWLDKEKIAYWFCVDDNSSKDDRALMRATFPWIKYHMKTESERGHRESMNIIWNKLQEIKPKYWIHMEDDFLFYTKRNYVEDSIKILKKYAANNIRQILFNRNYAETIEHTNTRGHIVLADDAVIPDIPVLFHNHNTVDKFYYTNCCYWPDYSFRPSMIDVGTILALGNYNTENQFFEMDYAKRWYNAGYRSAFYNLITCRHIGRLTSDRGDKTKPNSYELNNVSQFNTSNSSISPDSPDSPDSHICAVSPNARSDEEIRKAYSPPIKVSTDSYIKIVNMKHRTDRKNSTIQQLAAADFSPDDYEFIEAIYGKELQPSQELYTLFKDNDFGSRCGVMGCALSHYGLWLELLKDQKNDYYLIMEDDFTLCSEFKNKLNKLNKLFTDDDNKMVNYADFLFLGYTMFNKDRQKYKDIYDIESPTTKIDKLNKNLCIGGTFSYIITKNGANKIVDYIVKNGIKHGIDYVMKIHDMLDSYETQPHLLTAEWDETGKTFDTDIQHDRDSIDFNYFIKINNNDECTEIINQYFIFVPKLDQIGCDLYYKRTSLANMVLEAIKDKQCIAFNTLGFFKHDIKTLTISQWFGEKDGIYIKKEYYNKCINRDKREIREKCDNSDIKEIQNENLDNQVNRGKHVKRIKMICNWCSSYELCKEWSNMCTDTDKFMWNTRERNIEITWDNDDKNIDYYVIINMPRAGEYYDPKRTIVFQMEPWVYDTSKNWGVKTWGEWADPKNADFMGVFRHKEQLNNVQWQVALPAHIPGNDKSNRIISIISNKNIDEGHIKRIDFLKYLDKSNINGSSKIDVYGRENYHNLKAYVGTTDEKLEMGKYKYCFSCENNSEKNYATEKIWEPILFECLCFYWGCPNLEDYIDSRAFVRLPLDDIDGCISIITKAIEEDWWSQRIDIIRREKQKIINELGFFPRLDKFIDNL
jgi:GR25 family glycosyltransferase involved in LPS biosynthesis